MNRTNSFSEQVKDALAYLNMLANPWDVAAIKYVNYPDVAKRNNVILNKILHPQSAEYKS